MTDTPIHWRCGRFTFELGRKTRVMGILNVTPDSFSDGGSFSDPQQAVNHAWMLHEQGADIIDIGGESTRPGADAVSVAEELDRVAPVLEALAQQDDLALSIDTTKAEVAREALRLGACILNDVSGLTQDPDMESVAADSDAGIVIMHMQGRPRTMQDDPQYQNVVEDVGAFFDDRITSLTGKGISEDRIALDPGIGFGKTLEHNLSLLAGLGAYKKFTRPLLVGLSRKRFLGTLTGKDVSDRLHGGLSASAFAVMKGAHILRVHDVAEVRDAVTVLDALREYESTFGTAETDIDH